MIFARALIDSAWLGSLCAFVIFLVFSAVPKISAASRYATWCILLLLMLCLPFATLAGSLLHTRAPSVGGQSLAAAPLSNNERHTLKRTPANGPRTLGASPDLIGPALSASRRNIYEAAPSLWIALLMLWGSIAVFRLARLFGSVLAVLRIKRDAVALQSGLQLPRDAQLLAVRRAEAGVPCAVGYVKPAILVPASFNEAHTETSRNDILMHESAHLRRRDDWTALLYQLCYCLLWFNPIVTVIGKRMSLDREIACDDAVVAATRQPRRYAATLWGIAEAGIAGTNPLVPGALSEGSHIAARLQRLLTPRPKEFSRISRIALWAATTMCALALLIAGYLAPASAWARSDGGTILSVGTMSSTRADHTATLLPSGLVLIAGGLTGNTPDSALDSAELYDSHTHAFTSTGSMHEARAGATATLLDNGTVLIAGGWTPAGVTNAAELYHPSTGRFTRIGSMHAVRSNHTATLMRDGRVLLAGGEIANLQSTASAELYDPGTRKFTAVGPLHEARAVHAAVLLKNGRVLIAGGADNDEAIASTEIYNPSTQTFQRAQPMTSPRSKLAAVALRDGNVLLMGGQRGGPSGERLQTAEVYDMAKNRFAATGSMLDARFKIDNAAVLLNNGDVLVAGGSERPEIYNEALGRFSRVPGSLGIARHFGTATLLDGGGVLITGGYSMKPPAPQATETAVVYNQ